MCHADADVRKCLAQLLSDLVDVLDPVVQIKHLPIAGQLTLDDLPDHVKVTLDDIRLHRMTVAWRRVELRERTDAHQRHLQRARDRRRAQRKHIDAVLQFLDALLMLHAEALLLIDDQKAQIFPLHVFRKQPVRADDDVDLSLCHILYDLILFLARDKAVDHFDIDRIVTKTIDKGLVVLHREDSGRTKEGDLLVVHDCFERSAHRHLGLSESDIAAQQPVHRARAFHIMLDLFYGMLLILGQLVFELIFKLTLHRRIWRERKADVFAAQRIQFHQPAGQLLDLFADLAARLFPLAAAQLIELDADTFLRDEAPDQMKL